MPNNHIQTLKSAHEVLAEFSFKPARLERGYANRSLRIDLSSGGITELPVTQQMKDLWVGGKGFDLWYTLQEITAQTSWDSPENPICFSSGPLGGTPVVPRFGQDPVHRDLAADAHHDRLQRGRVLRPLPEVRRLRRPGPDGDGQRAESSSTSTPRAGRITIEKAPAGEHRLARPVPRS